MIAATCCAAVVRRSVMSERRVNTCHCQLSSLYRHRGDRPASTHWPLLRHRRHWATDRTKIVVVGRHSRRATRQNCVGRMPSTAPAATATNASSRTAATTCEPLCVTPSTRPTFVERTTRPVCVHTDLDVTSSTTRTKSDADQQLRRRPLPSSAMSTTL